MAVQQELVHMEKERGKNWHDKGWIESEIQRENDSVLHSSVPALPGSTNPTGCYDMTWCAKRGVSYLSVDSRSNPVQVLHPNSHAERNPSISTQLISQYSQPHTYVYAFRAHWNSDCTLNLPRTHMNLLKSYLSHQEPFSLSFSIAKKTLSSHFPCDLYFSLTYFQLK